MLACRHIRASSCFTVLGMSHAQTLITRGAPDTYFSSVTPASIALARAHPPFYFEATIRDITLRTTPLSRVSLFSLKGSFCNAFTDTLDLLARLLSLHWDFSNTPHDHVTLRVDGEEHALHLAQLRALLTPLRALLANPAEELRLLERAAPSYLSMPGTYPGGRTREEFIELLKGGAGRFLEFGAGLESALEAAAGTDGALLCDHDT